MVESLAMEKGFLAREFARAPAAIQRSDDARSREAEERTRGRTHVADPSKLRAVEMSSFSAISNRLGKYELNYRNTIAAY